MSLTMEELKDIGIKSLGKRKELMFRIEALKDAHAKGLLDPSQSKEIGTFKI